MKVRASGGLAGLRIVVAAFFVSVCAAGSPVVAQEAPQVRPSSLTVPADGGRASFSMLGQGLGLFRTIAIVAEDGRSSTDGITIRMGRSRGTRRNASIVTSGASAGRYTVQLTDRLGTVVDLSLEVTIEAAAAPVLEVPRVRPGSLTVPADRGRASFSMTGVGLGLFRTIELVAEDGASSDGIRIAMGRSQGTRRNASVRTSGAAGGTFTVRLTDQEGETYDLDLTVTVEAPPAAVNADAAGGATGGRTAGGGGALASASGTGTSIAPADGTDSGGGTGSTLSSVSGGSTIIAVVPTAPPPPSLESGSEEALAAIGLTVKFVGSSPMWLRIESVESDHVAFQFIPEWAMRRSGDEISEINGSSVLEIPGPDLARILNDDDYRITFKRGSQTSRWRCGLETVVVTESNSFRYSSYRSSGYRYSSYYRWDSAPDSTETVEHRVCRQ